MRTTSVGLSAVPALRGPLAVASMKRIEAGPAADAVEPAATEAVRALSSKAPLLKMALIGAIVILFVGAMVAPVMA